MTDENPPSLTEHWDSTNPPDPAYSRGDELLHPLMGPVVVELVDTSGRFPRYRVRRIGLHLRFVTSGAFLSELNR